jgi:dinuclear metal center YbgI/SA1388 family protein
MTTVKDVFDLLQKKAPFEYQMGFDNAGFLVGHQSAPVRRVLVSLDITEEVAAEAAAAGCQLIVAHHPVIWGGAKSVTDQTPTGRKLLALVENKIAAICAHTNLDAVADGVNDVLAQALGLQEVEMLEQDGVDEQGRPYGIGRVGVVEEQSLEQFARFVKEKLGSNGVRLVDGGRPVRKVAVGGGSCSDMMGTALALGCDTFVTADVKYDGFLDAKAQGLSLIDAGHFPTENVVCPVLKQWVSQAFPELEVTVSRVHHEVFSYL